MEGTTEREEIGVASGISIVLAAWEIGSPWIHHYAGNSLPLLNEIISGAIVLFVALVGLFALFGLGRSQWIGWALVFMGAWLFLSPIFLFYNNQTAQANDMIIGMSVFALGLLAALGALTKGGMKDVFGRI